MKRHLTAALTAVLVLGGAFAQAVQLDSRVFDIARQLRCPVCTSESVADSSVELAHRTLVLNFCAS